MAGPFDYYKPGSHNLLCARTGFKIKGHVAKKEWTNQIVRRESFELRHPQDFLRSKPDRQTIEDARPEPTANTFLGVNEVFDVYNTDAQTATATPTANGGNTGDGTVDNLTADLTADTSGYTLTVSRVSRAAEDAQDPGDNGAWRLVDSNTQFVAEGDMGILFCGGGLAFTLNEDGSTAFIVGDSFTIAVTVS